MDRLAERGIMISSSQISRVSVERQRENEMFIREMKEVLENAGWLHNSTVRG